MEPNVNQDYPTNSDTFYSPEEPREQRAKSKAEQSEAERQVKLLDKLIKRWKTKLEATGLESINVTTDSTEANVISQIIAAQDLRKTYRKEVDYLQKLRDSIE